MCAGAALTVGATAAAYVDRITAGRLAQHIREGYPTYSPDRVDAAVNAWLVLLTVIGVLGVVSWIATIRVVRRHRAWARWVVATVFAAGTGVALAALLVRDTSGEAGLAPILGWLGMVPSLAGLVAVAATWRRS